MKSFEDTLRAIAHEMPGITVEQAIRLHDTLSDGIPADVRAYINAGQKIAAIKAYRAARGGSLLEAKTAVEAAWPPAPTPRPWSYE